jgi:hypothetical protein
VNFASAFPLGVMIGTTSGFSAKFTSAEAIDAFLPQSGPSGSLGGNWLNPVTMANSLAGNTLALAITVGFDAQFSNFSPGVLPLQDLVVADPASPFLGYAVRDVLALANQVLSGQEDARFTADQINEGVLQINMTFQDGTVDLGFLSLP